MAFAVRTALLLWCDLAAKADRKQAEAGVSAWEFAFERASDLIEDGLPIAGAGLPEDAHGRIPGTGIAVEEPAPIGRKRQQEPRGNAECRGEMGRGVVDGDHKIHGGNFGGEDVDIGELIDAAIDQKRGRCPTCLGFENGGIAVLQADPAGLG